MVFKNIKEFRAALLEHSVRSRMKMNKLKNEKNRVTAKCGATGCKWRIHASPTVLGEPEYMVKTYYPEHTCVRPEVSKCVSSNWVAKILLPALRDNPRMDNEQLKAELKKYNVDATYSIIYRGKRKALQTIVGEGGTSKTKRPRKPKCKVKQTVPRGRFSATRCSNCRGTGKE